MDDITEDVPNKVRIVDDTLLYEKGLPVCFVALCARNEVVFNPEKFKFGRKEVDFAGSISRMMVLNRQRECLKLLPISLNLQI